MKNQRQTMPERSSGSSRPWASDFGSKRDPHNRRRYREAGVGGSLLLAEDSRREVNSDLACWQVKIGETRAT